MCDFFDETINFDSSLSKILRKKKEKNRELNENKK